MADIPETPEARRQRRVAVLGPSGATREADIRLDTSMYWTSTEVLKLPYDEWHRYEIIDGVLYVSPCPPMYHSYTCAQLLAALVRWDDATHLGLALPGLGVIFAPDNEAIPDILWISRGRKAQALDVNGHLTLAPELMVEVLVAAPAASRRDRVAKLAQYSRFGVQEYWMVDPLAQTIDVYRQQTGRLAHVDWLTGEDTLISPLLPGFRCEVAELCWTTSQH